MASSSLVESIFFAALEKNGGAERAAYLDDACGADSLLRFPQERLEPAGEIHFFKGRGHANVSQVSCAVPRGNIQAPAKRDRQMGKVPARHQRVH